MTRKVGAASVVQRPNQTLVFIDQQIIKEHAEVSQSSRYIKADENGTEVHFGGETEARAMLAALRRLLGE